jgi:hypothetical protein
MLSENQSTLIKNYYANKKIQTEYINNIKTIISKKKSNFSNIFIYTTPYVNEIAITISEIFTINGINNSIHTSLVSESHINIVNNDDDYKIFIIAFQSFFTGQKSNLMQLKPYTYILYQLEQVNTSEKYHNIIKPYIENFMKKSLLILEYNNDNYNMYKNIKNIHEVKIPINSKLLIHNDKDIDLLFYGTMNDRRKKILDSYKKHFKIVILTDVFGNELQEYLKKSKIVLNIHYYENALLETCRINEVLRYGCKIISENVNSNNDNMYGNMILFTDFFEIEETVELISKSLRFIDIDNSVNEKKKIITDIISQNNSSFMNIVKYIKYPYLFNKYLLKLSDVNNEIKYDVIRSNILELSTKYISDISSVNEHTEIIPENIIDIILDIFYKDGKYNSSDNKIIQSFMVDNKEYFTDIIPNIKNYIKLESENDKEIHNAKENMEIEKNKLHTTLHIEINNIEDEFIKNKNNIDIFVENKKHILYSTDKTNDILYHEKKFATTEIILKKELENIYECNNENYKLYFDSLPNIKNINDDLKREQAILNSNIKILENEIKDISETVNLNRPLKIENNDYYYLYNNTMESLDFTDENNNYQDIIYNNKYNIKFNVDSVNLIFILQKLKLKLNDIIKNIKYNEKIINIINTAYEDIKKNVLENGTEDDIESIMENKLSILYNLCDYRIKYADLVNYYDNTMEQNIYNNIYNNNIEIKSICNLLKMNYIQIDKIKQIKEYTIKHFKTYLTELDIEYYNKNIILLNNKEDSINLLHDKYLKEKQKVTLDYDNNIKNLIIKHNESNIIKNEILETFKVTLINKFTSYIKKNNKRKEILTECFKKDVKAKFNHKNIVNHIHCYNLYHFDEIYKNYIDVIKNNLNAIIIVTYSIGELDNITEIDIENFIFLKIKNIGQDIGGKLCIIDYLHKNFIDYSHIIFLHSKTNIKCRKKYFSFISQDKIDNINDYISENIDGIFPNIKRTGDWGSNEFIPNKHYINNILDLLNINDTSSEFIEGNCMILSKRVIVKLFVENLYTFYNLLNYENTFDLNWVIWYYKLFNEDLSNVYNKYINEKLYGNDRSHNYTKIDDYHKMGNTCDGYKFADAMIEHAFERLYLQVINSFRDGTYKLI